MIENLSIIGESINDSIPTTRSYYDTEDYAAIRELAKFQADGGARYIDVNVGARSADVMVKAAQAAQEGGKKPLSIDSPDLALAEAGLAVCDRALGKPILNSISPLRTEMFDLYAKYPFRPILLISENVSDSGERFSCHTADETYDAALSLFELARKAGIPNDDIIFDPGIAPIATDTEGNLPRLIETLRRIQANPEMAGVHASVGLSNFTVMLPPRRKDGSPVKGPLESGFLTRALPLGLDYVIGSVKRNYQLLAEGDPALKCVDFCIEKSGMETLMIVLKFYR
jgi:5-methyltetrahydrofolate--homocysteine methyltransferase